MSIWVNILYKRDLTIKEERDVYKLLINYEKCSKTMKNEQKWEIRDETICVPISEQPLP